MMGLKYTIYARGDAITTNLPPRGAEEEEPNGDQIPLRLIISIGIVAIICSTNSRVKAFN